VKEEKAQPVKGEIMEKKPKVLFLSTGNSTRSQIAEGFLHTMTDDHFATVSAGIESGGLDPVGAEVMEEAGVEIGQHVEDVSQAIKEHFGYVITFYDAARERSPTFPFTVNLMRRSVADPVRMAASAGEKKEMFRRVRDEIRDCVSGFVSDVIQKEREQTEQARTLR